MFNVSWAKSHSLPAAAFEKPVPEEFSQNNINDDDDADDINRRQGKGDGGVGGWGELAGLITSFQPESCLCEYWKWGVWESGVIVTFSLWLRSISNRTAGRTQAFPSASSWACQPIRHLRDYQQLEK